MLRKAGNRDFLPHLETDLEVFGDLRQVMPELGGGGRSVERRVVPHGPEQRLALVLILAILLQTFMGKRALGILPFVDLTLPAFVGPGGGTEANQWGEREGHRERNCTVSAVAHSTSGAVSIATASTAITLAGSGVLQRSFLGLPGKKGQASSAAWPNSFIKLLVVCIVKSPYSS
jgi:hypothetical protein